MSGWILVEDMDEYGEPRVDVINVANVLDFYAYEHEGQLRVIAYPAMSGTESVIYLRDWKEFEKFLLMLPGVDQLGWLHVRDGVVMGQWRGILRVLEEKAGEEAKELTPEEEAEVLEGEGDE